MTTPTKKQIGYIDKTTVSLMCKAIREQGVDVNQLVFEDTEKAIEYLHGQYQQAKQTLYESAHP